MYVELISILVKRRMERRLCSLLRHQRMIVVVVLSGVFRRSADQPNIRGDTQDEMIQVRDRIRFEDLPKECTYDLISD